MLNQYTSTTGTNKVTHAIQIRHSNNVNGRRGLETLLTRDFVAFCLSVSRQQRRMVSPQPWSVPELLLWLDHPAVEAGSPQAHFRLHLRQETRLWCPVVSRVRHSVRSCEWGTAGDLGPEIQPVGLGERNGAWWFCDLNSFFVLSCSLDPVIVQPVGPDVKPTSLLFAPQTDCVLVGDSSGQVTIYQLQNLSVGWSSQVCVCLNKSQTNCLCISPCERSWKETLNINTINYWWPSPKFYCQFSDSLMINVMKKRPQGPANWWTLSYPASCHN